jgi:hypothetical protein
MYHSNKINKNINSAKIVLSDSKEQLYKFNYIVELVINFYGADKDKIINNGRKFEVVRVRQIAHYLLRKNTKTTLGKIGKYFNGKDHATVINSIKAVNNMIDTDKITKTEVGHLQSLIDKKFDVFKRNKFYHYYFIDFNNFTSFKINDKKGLMLTGFNNEELEKIKEFIGNIKESKEHENTAFYILDNKKED